MSKRRVTQNIAFFLLFVALTPAFAAKQSKRDSLLKLPLFAENSLLRIELKTDLAALIDDTGNDRGYHDSKLRILDKGGNGMESVEVEVKTRGNFRRRKQNCDFPPLRFKIPANEAVGTVFEGQDKLKYVSHCQSFIEGYDQHAVEEYLIYKMYNLVSNHSYRVRLAQIAFIDNNLNDTIKKYGFFIEDRDDVAARNGKKIMRFRNLKQYNLLRKEMVMLSLFQLMIGNSDWDVGRLHNIDLMSVDEQSIPVPVPYDFDWSAIINHSYFIPDPTIDPNARFKRKYKGWRWNPEEFDAAFLRFGELKKPFSDLISGCKYLKKENQVKMKEYISEFYELIDSKRNVRTFIEKKSPKLPKR